MQSGYASSNKGIAWWHPYIDEQGNFKVMLVPSEECAPEWQDNSHTDLSAMHRIYNTVYFKGTDRKTQRHVETWTADGLVCRIEDEGLYYLDSNRNPNGSPVGHYKENGEDTTWERVPFIAVKNNYIELPDIKFVKSLIDGYDKGRSEVANYVEDVKNLIYVLKGYGGEYATLDNFMHDLNMYRAILLDADTDDETSGVTTLTPTMDITALKEHYEQLKRDITEAGQGVNKDLDKFGSAPSGVALNFLYSGLNLKSNALLMHAEMAFEQLMYFINRYLGIENAPKVTITFHQDMKINETENIDNCVKAKQIMSDDTWMSHCAWIDNVQQEQANLKAQQEENVSYPDHVKLSGNDNGEE